MGSLLIFSWLWSKKGLPCGCQIVRRRKQRSRAPPCSLRPYARPCICPCARFSSFSEIEGKHMCACIFQSCGDATRLHTRSVCLLVKSLGLFEHGFKPDFPPPTRTQEVHVELTHMFLSPTPTPTAQVLEREWLEGCRVLDIGCNEGLVTLAVAQKFGCRKVTGLDIDPTLISMASRWVGC